VQAIWEFIKRLFKALFPFPEKKETKVYITRTPRLNDVGGHVLALQKALNRNGFDLLEDGDFGPLTRSAVSAFQKRMGLAGSGIIGPKTLEFLGLELRPRDPSTIGDIRGRVFAIAQGEIGVRSIPGPQHHPRILEYHSTTGNFSDDETAWCSSFVNWVLKQSGIQGTGSAAARSWMQWSIPTNSPKRGDIVVLWRNDPSSWQGHVGFYVSETATHINILGGNQSNAVNIQAYPKSRLLGYRTYTNGN
jgi:uncharacterized protein (TIGR02594 family)